MNYIPINGYNTIRLSDQFKAIQCENDSKLKDAFSILWDERFIEFGSRKIEILSITTNNIRPNEIFLTADKKFGVNHLKTKFYIVLPVEFTVNNYIAACLSKEGFLLKNIFARTYNDVKSRIIGFEYLPIKEVKCCNIV